MIRCVLMDIEGTTTPIAFVHEVLFPYSARHMRRYVDEHGNDTGEDVETLLRWIKEDKKEPALKTIQGKIWKTGYEDGTLQSIVYDDVDGAMRAWKDRGLMLAIYSSGSVAAQKLLFKYTIKGDLTPLLSAYFDTAVGPKREAASYRAIIAQLRLAPDEIHFLSDIAEELDAAREAGMAATQILRPGTKPAERHATAETFYDLPI